MARQHPRYDATIRVDFTDADEFLSSYTSSVSQGGLFVESDDPLPTGATVRLHLRLPNRGETLEVTGVVAYQTQGDDETVSRPAGMGIQFDKLEPGPRAALDDYIRFLENKSRGRVLVIDDDADYARMLQDVLRQQDYSVVTTNASQAGIHTLERGGPFDAVVVELCMPRMDGLEVLDAIRERVDKKLPVVMVTNEQIDSAQRDVADRLDVTRILRKPVVLADLVNVLDRTVAGAFDPIDTLTGEIVEGGFEPLDTMTGEVIVRDDVLELETSASKFDPSLESTLAEQRKAALAAKQQLESLGVDTNFSADGTEVYGELAFEHVDVKWPFTRKRLRSVQLRAIDSDRARLYDPPIMEILPDLSIRRLGTKMRLEKDVQRIILSQERICMATGAWFERLGIKHTLDPDTFTCRAEIHIDGSKLVVAGAGPNRIQVVSVDSIDAAAVLGDSVRVLDVQGVGDALELEMRLDAVARKVLERSRDTN